jgi:hypothetical protein
MTALQRLVASCEPPGQLNTAIDAHVLVGRSRLLDWCLPQHLTSDSAWSPCRFFDPAKPVKYCITYADIAILFYIPSQLLVTIALRNAQERCLRV